MKTVFTFQYIPIIFYSGGGGNGSQGGPAGGGVRVFDVETSQEERSSLKGHEDYIHDMDYCPQSNALVSASGKVQSRMYICVALGLALSI